jgi:hypothetical protein
MKRINNNNSLKPLLGTCGEPPFYDPNDLHEHIWQNGKLTSEEDPKIQTYNTSKIKIQNCIYCKICHKVKYNFKSSIGDNKDIDTSLKSILVEKSPISYSIIHSESSPSVTIDLVTEDNKSHVIFPKSKYDHLFVNDDTSNSFKNYITID